MGVNKNGIDCSKEVDNVKIELSPGGTISDVFQGSVNAGRIAGLSAGMVIGKYAGAVGGMVLGAPVEVATGGLAVPLAASGGAVVGAAALGALGTGAGLIVDKAITHVQCEYFPDSFTPSTTPVGKKAATRTPD